jgi:hypothetical protein
MARFQALLIALLLTLLPGWVAAQSCSAGFVNTFTYGYCLYSTATVTALNQPYDASYTWTASGCTIIQNNGASIKVYFPNPGQVSVTLVQTCPITYGANSTSTWYPYIHSGTQASGYGGNFVDTRDTVLADTPINVGYTWNYVPMPNHTTGYPLLYPTPTSKVGVSLGSITPVTSGYHTDSAAQTFNSNYSLAKFGLAVTRWNYCSDTVYNYAHVLGALNGPQANCLNDIVTYNLPVGIVNAWTVTGGVILSGQGTNTVQVQWTTAGAGTVQCNWSYGAWGTNTTSRSITVGSGTTPVITGSTTLCNNFQSYSVPNISGHSYRWNVNGVNTSTGSTMGLTPGNQPTYNIVVYDSIGTCVGTASMTVTNPIYPHPVITGPTDICEGSTQTYSVATVTGATYAWNTPGATVISGAGTNSITVRPTTTGPRNFSVVVTVSGCTRTVQKSVNVLPAQIPNLGANFTICAGAPATITNSNYLSSFSISYTSSIGYTNGQTMSVSTPGSYWMQTTISYNAATCVSRDTVVANSGTSLNVTLGPDQQICGGTTTLTPSFSGSVGPYTYAWSTGATTPTINVGLGTYRVTVTASGYCVDADTIVVSPVPSVGVSLGPDQSVCPGATTTLTPTFSGSVGPYTYAWSTGATTPTLTAGAGTYRVTVTASGYCVDADTIVINATPSVGVSLGPDQVICGATTTLAPSFTGSVGPYTYAWSTGATTPTLTTGPGTYFVTVTAVGYCVDADTIVVSAGLSVGVSLGPDQQICFSPSTTLTPSFSGSVGPYTYAWSTGATTSAVTVGPGTYMVTVTATGYCVDADTIVVSGNSMPSVSLPSNASLCPGGSLLLDAGPGYASYLWSTGATTQSISVTLPGVYSVTATDLAGCQSSTSTTVQNFPTPSTILGMDTTICPDTFAVFSSAPFMTYIWSTGAMGGSIQATTAGTYTITVTDVNGCVWTDDVVLSLNTDCIWPGDANHDGVADNADILAIGYAMPATGPTRLNASTSWYGQVCSDWLLAFPSTLNFKHADADGNGVADFPDTMVVIQNYGLTHNKGTGLSAGPALTFVPLQPSYTVGDVVEIGIQLGDASVPALGVNGIAYTVTVGGIATAPGDVWFSFPSSFMGNVGNDAVAVGFEDVAPSRHDVGQSRVGVSPVSGHGQIAILHIQTDSFMLPLPQNALTFNFSGALLVGDSLQSLPIAAVNGGVTVNGSVVNGTQAGADASIQVFPIPSDEILHLRRIEASEALGVEVFDLAGKSCYRQTFEGLSMDLPTRDWSNGTYLLVVKGQGGVIHREKVVVLHGR